jgi:hypothetical protein
MVEVLERETRSALPSVLDALMWPDETAAYLSVTAPGGAATALLDVLDPAVLTHAGRIDALVAVQRAQAWLAAREQALLAALVTDARMRDSLRDPSGNCWLAEEVGCALRLAPSTAEGRLAQAEDLTDRFSATLRLLECGEITAVHAWVLADETRVLNATQAAAVEARVLPRAPAQTVGEFKRAVRRAVKTADARRDEQRHQDAVSERRVVCTPREDGTAEIWALLPADGARIVMAGLARYAKPAGPADDRTADQRRADALVELGLAAMTDPRVPGKPKPAVSITVGLETLLGDNDQPAEMTGYGPIPASMARRIAADPSGTWRRLITDPAGRLLDYGSRTYKPPTELDRHVKTRDRTCVVPGCGRPAADCETDHRIPYPTGPTSAANLQPLCKRHHIMKHHSHWHLDKLPDGTYEWTTPTGRRYRYKPPPLPPPITQPTEAAPTTKINEPAPF